MEFFRAPAQTERHARQALGGSGARVLHRSLQCGTWGWTASEVWIILWHRILTQWLTTQQNIDSSLRPFLPTGQKNKKIKATLFFVKPKSVFKSINLSTMISWASSWVYEVPKSYLKCHTCKILGEGESWWDGKGYLVHSFP